MLNEDILFGHALGENGCCRAAEKKQNCKFFHVLICLKAKLEFQTAVRPSGLAKSRQLSDREH
jgi:hypothetical protein